MVRRSSASSSNARSSEPEAGSPAGDPGTTPGADASGAQVPGDASVAGDAAAAKPKRKRGPNKPKAVKTGTFTVETKARLKEEQIIQLLTAHAVTELGADVAERLSLQVLVEGVLRPLGDVLPEGASLEFATRESVD